MLTIGTKSFSHYTCCNKRSIGQSVENDIVDKKESLYLFCNLQYDVLHKYKISKSVGQSVENDIVDKKESLYWFCNLQHDVLPKYKISRCNCEVIKASSNH